MNAVVNDSEIKRGLAGVVVDETAISKVMQEINSLTYRGYPVQELAQSCCFEEVAYLLWFGELPSQAQLDEFRHKERSLRKVGANLQAMISQFPSHAHPMDSTRTALSLLALEDLATADNSVKSSQEKAINLLAKLPTIVAILLRSRKKQAIIEPRDDLSFSENFFYMCFGQVPEKEVIKCFDISMILYAEHSFNASTFTGRVVMSTESDLYSAVTAAIAALKGPLHGGANEAVMHMMKAIGCADKAEAWLDNALAEKHKIMGFGHRVYRNGDSRVPTMQTALFKMAAIKDNTQWTDIYQVLASKMAEKKAIYPNLDFPAGPAYYLMGFDIDFFTPLFVMARVTGWTAHFIEQQNNNRLIRPLSAYKGHTERHL